MLCKCFILHVTNVKHLQNVFANVMQMFYAAFFSLLTCKIKYFYNILRTWRSRGKSTALKKFLQMFYYLCQVNEVNGGDNVFVRRVCLCLSVRSGRSWELNANSSKTVTATDFKFDTRVPRDSPDMTPTNFPKTWRL